MGFWHTSYFEHHEAAFFARQEAIWGWGPPAPPKPPQYPCIVCRMVFSTPDDLRVHTFDGHTTVRPTLILRGRECGRSRLSVISATQPEDWTFRDTRTIRVNGEKVTDEEARSILSSVGMGVVSVELSGDRIDQCFEFSFRIANDQDLQSVDERLQELIAGRSLTINSIESFLDRATPFRTARGYRDAIANYLYGVLERETSPEESESEPYDGHGRCSGKFDEAVAELGQYDRSPAEAICGLVAFHYNQFDLALRRTRSPRIARVALRVASLLAVDSHPSTDLSLTELDDRGSLDYVLSDSTTEKVIEWCSIRLDGTEQRAVDEMEGALRSLEPSDAFKIHLVVAEHYLAAGSERGLPHAASLRHSPVAESWASSYRERLFRAGIN